jgi:hypothetical protein
MFGIGVPTFAAKAKSFIMDARDVILETEVGVPSRLPTNPWLD